MATSPAPDAAAPPGMCPGIAVLGGGGGGGDGDGSGSGGKDGSGGNGSGNGEGGAGDGKGAQGAPDYQKYPTCGFASHPVDVVTGRAFTHPIADLELPGPLPLAFNRMYSSKMADRDVGLGYGWAHTFGWEIEVGRQRIRVWNEQGIAVDFPMIPAGGETLGPWGWLLRRDGSGFALDADDGLSRLFVPADERGKRYRLAAVEDRNRNRIALTYERARLVEIVDSAGRVIRVLPNEEGRIASIEVRNAAAPHGRWVAFGTYTYDDRGNLAGVRDADGFASRYEYDDEHHLTADADRTGLTFHFVYDREGRCVESWGDYPGKRDPSLCHGLPQRLADGVTRVKGIHHCRFEYTPGGYSEVADSIQVRRFFGNAHGTLDKSVEGVGVVTCTYTELGHLASHTDQLGGTATFERDRRGRLLKLTDAMGRVTQVELSDHGLPATIKDPGGGVTTFVRDAFGNVVHRVDAAGNSTVFRYDSRGLLTESIGPLGHGLRLTYDAQGNVTSRTEHNGATTTFVHDELGRTTSFTDPGAATFRYVYSDRGDLLETHDPLGGVARYRYDGEGHVVELQNVSGASRKMRWGGYHKPCEVEDELGNVTKVLYDLDGYPVRLLNPKGEVHSYQHTPRGSLASEVTFDGVKRAYRYDLAERLVAMTNARGDVMELKRDACGLIESRVYADETVETLERDACSRVVKAVTGNVELRFERDAIGQIHRQTHVIDGKSCWVAFSRQGHRTITSTSHGHTIAVEEPDAATRRIVLGGDHTVVAHVDALGRELARELPGGATIASTFDPLGRLVERAVLSKGAHVPVAPGQPEWLGPRDAGATVRRSYRYDVNGNVVDASDLDRGPVHYELDPVGQLVAVLRGGDVSESFRYDVNGNLLEGGVTREYGPGNRLLRRGRATYRYDDLGQLVEKRVATDGGEDLVWEYTWNGAERLTAVVAPGGVQTQFAYDAMGRRVQKRVSRPDLAARGTGKLESETTFIWNGSVLAQEIKRIARAEGDPVIEERSYWFSEDGIPLAHREIRHDERGTTEGEWLHYVNDPIGTPERLVDGKGVVVCDLERSAFGETQVHGTEQSHGTPIRFMGQYEDEETALHYNHFRYYDPETGRFLSHDPIGLEGGHNLFRYVRDPNSATDPLGLVGCHCVLITGNGPASQQVPGTNLYAWRRNSGGNGEVDASRAGAVHPAVAANIPAAAGENDQRGKCAEPRVLSDYQRWLAANPGQAPDVRAIVPMYQRDGNDGGAPVARGQARAPCGPYCSHMLPSMGLGGTVMTPGAAATATGLPPGVFTVQQSGS
jgi:RHS repeat-associated protein